MSEPKITSDILGIRRIDIPAGTYYDPAFYYRKDMPATTAWHCALTQTVYGRERPCVHQTRADAIRCRLVRLLDVWTATPRTKKAGRINESFADPEWERGPVAGEFNTLLRAYWQEGAA